MTVNGLQAYDAPNKRMGPTADRAAFQVFLRLYHVVSNFGLAAAPIGKCILWVQGYGLDPEELKGPRGFFSEGNPKKVAQDEEMDDPKTKERTLLEALLAWGRGKSLLQPVQPSLIR